MINLKKFDRDKKRNEFKVSCKQLKRMLTDNRHGWGYFHLTTWSSLCKMMEYVTLPDGSKHRMLHLSAAVTMNDRDDKKCGNGVYFASFSFGLAENVSMWTNYGIPNKDSVRVKFHTPEVWEWVATFRKGQIKVYGVCPDGSLEPLSAKPILRMVDVAYWSPDKQWNKRNDPNDGIFIHDRNKFRLIDCESVDNFMGKDPYMFKEAGWNYESETRLVLIFKKDLADKYQRVAIPFDEPFNTLDQNFGIHVWRGPWFETIPDEKAAGHSLDEALASDYEEKIKMRSACDACEDWGTVNCKCRYKGQR